MKKVILILLLLSACGGGDDIDNSTTLLNCSQDITIMKDEEFEIALEQGDILDPVSIEDIGNGYVVVDATVCGELLTNPDTNASL